MYLNPPADTLDTVEEVGEETPAENEEDDMESMVIEEEIEADEFAENPRGPAILPINAVTYKRRKGPAIANLSTSMYRHFVKTLKQVCWSGSL